MKTQRNLSKQTTTKDIKKKKRCKIYQKLYALTIDNNNVCEFDYELMNRETMMVNRDIWSGYG